jgi:hypothetical protein
MVKKAESIEIFNFTIIKHKNLFSPQTRKGFSPRHSLKDVYQQEGEKMSLVIHKMILTRSWLMDVDLWLCQDIWLSYIHPQVLEGRREEFLTENFSILFFES